MLDGACDVDKLCKRVKDLGMPAVAMTDHGNIFGAVHFVNAAKAAGIKPIIGCELYVCKKDDHRVERTPPDGDTYNHLLVLAENEEIFLGNRISSWKFRTRDWRWSTRSILVFFSCRRTSGFHWSRRMTAIISAKMMRTRRM